METGEGMQLEMEKEQLLKRVIFGFERMQYVESDQPNISLEGQLFRNGFAQENLEFEEKKDQLKSLYIRLLGVAAVLNARKASWRNEDIQKTVGEGRMYARDARRYQQISGKTPFEAFATRKIITPQIRLGKIK